MADTVLWIMEAVALQSGPLHQQQFQIVTSIVFSRDAFSSLFFPRETSFHFRIHSDDSSSSICKMLCNCVCITHVRIYRSPCFPHWYAIWIVSANGDLLPLLQPLQGVLAMCLDSFVAIGTEREASRYFPAFCRPFTFYHIDYGVDTSCRVTLLCPAISCRCS